MAMLVNNLLFKCQQEEKGKYKQLQIKSLMIENTDHNSCNE